MPRPRTYGDGEYFLCGQNTMCKPNKTMSIRTTDESSSSDSPHRAAKTTTPRPQPCKRATLSQWFYAAMCLWLAPTAKPPASQTTAHTPNGWSAQISQSIHRHGVVRRRNPNHRSKWLGHRSPLQPLHQPHRTMHRCRPCLTIHPTQSQESSMLEPT